MKEPPFTVVMAQICEDPDATLGFMQGIVEGMLQRLGVNIKQTDTHTQYYLECIPYYYQSSYEKHTKTLIWHAGDVTKIQEKYIQLHCLVFHDNK